MHIQGLIFASILAQVLSTSRSPDDFIAKLGSTGTQAGASPTVPNSVSRSDGPDTGSIVSVKDIHTIPSEGITSTSFTGTSSVNFLPSGGDYTAVAANTKEVTGVNAAPLTGTPAGISTGDATGVQTSLADAYTGLSTGSDTRADGTAPTGTTGTSNTGMLGASGTGAVTSTGGNTASANTGGLVSITAGNGMVSGSNMGAAAQANNQQGTPTVNPPYLPTQTQQFNGGATQTTQGTASNLGSGSAPYTMTGVGVSGQPNLNQVQPVPANTGNLWGQGNPSPVQGSGMPTQGFNGPYNPGANMYNPYYYNQNPYANQWSGFGYPYNNQMYNGPRGFNWHGSNMPNTNAITTTNNANGNRVPNAGNGIAGTTGGNTGGGGGGGGLGYNPYNTMAAWQAAQTQSWLYPMFLFDLMF